MSYMQYIKHVLKKLDQYSHCIPQNNSIYYKMNYKTTTSCSLYQPINRREENRNYIVIRKIPIFYECRREREREGTL